MSKIEWTNEVRTLGDLIPWARNPRTTDDVAKIRLQRSKKKFNQTHMILIGPSNEIYDGHQRAEAWAKKLGGDLEVEVRVCNRELTELERQELTIVHHAATMGEWDAVMLEDWDIDDKLIDWGMDVSEMVWEDAEDEATFSDAEPQVDKAEALRDEWGVEVGQLWQLGDHRLICGDCTDPEVVARLMDGERATLCHADPPYGMGKEKDGIVNDNLYREKLDGFQMAWWHACRASLADNASAYIWGNAPDLWRLWYAGGLRDSERLTFRNEIVWDKGGGQGMKSDINRMYPTASERCLFFMLGEQGFNNNADNYWEGWEPIRKYLYDERIKAGWDIPTMKRIVGHSDLSRDHWTSKSQWSFPTREVYEAMQQAAQGHAFKRDYDDLKREFYATRAHFDNTHDNMTDVWNYQRVTGADRWEHATPKPVEMVARIVKSSSTETDIVLDPFLGSGTTLIACHNLNRRCRAIEIAPEYVAVALQRFQDATGIVPELVE